MTGLALAAAAEKLVGAPFRLHGRDPQTGLDCIGVLTSALGEIGRSASLPANYALKSRMIPDLNELADRCGLIETQGALMPGDVVFTRVSPCQHHLLLAVRQNRFVHAHAGLRRVVISDGPLPWPAIACWQLNETI